MIKNQELNKNFDYMTLFRGAKGENLGEKGYIDYPYYEEWKKSQVVAWIINYFNYWF